MNIEKWRECLEGGRMGRFKPAKPSGTRDHPFRWIVQETLDLIPDGGHRRDVLDVGCGDGWSANYLGERFPGASLRGLTASEEDKKMAEERHPAVDVTVGDAHDMPYPDGSQDIVVLRDSLEHMVAPFLVLEECWRVMRDGAWLLVAVPDQEWQDAEDHMVVPNHRQMLHLFYLAGLDVEKASEKEYPREAALTEWRYLCRKARAS